MKKPRPQDFDPGYKEKKPFKPEEVDLSGVIGIKPKPEIFNKPQNTKYSVQDERTEIRTKERTEIRSENRSVELPIKRSTKRYSFEFYEDQIAEVKKIKIETEMNGQNIALSEIVRNALDLYFKTVWKTERSE
jgi:hypothetical protein